MDEINKALRDLRFTPQVESSSPKSELEQQNDSQRLNSLLNDLSSLSLAPKISHSYISPNLSQSPRSQEGWPTSLPKFIPPTRSMWIPPDPISQLQQGCLHSTLIVVEPFVIGLWFTPNPKLSTVKDNNGVSPDDQRWYLKAGNVVVKFACSDGQCFRATFNAKSGAVELKVLDSGYRPVENRYPIEFPGLDVPDIVCEYAALVLGAPFLPELVGDNGGQLLSLVERARFYSASYPLHPPKVTVDLATTQEEAELLLQIQNPVRLSGSNFQTFCTARPRIYETFFKAWTTEHIIDTISLCEKRKSKHREGLRCVCVNCAELRVAIRAEGYKISQGICSNVLHWVMRSLAVADENWISAGLNLRKERMRHWTNFIKADPALLSWIFSSISVYIDLKNELQDETCRRALTVVAARLADDILLYQIAQGTELKVFSLWIIENFTEVVTGKGLCCETEVAEDVPPRH